jgi:hypothetical protein
MSEQQNLKSESLEIDLNEFSKEQLIGMIQTANEKNITFNELFSWMLENFIKNNEQTNKQAAEN